MLRLLMLRLLISCASLAASTEVQSNLLEAAEEPSELQDKMIDAVSLLQLKKSTAKTSWTFFAERNYLYYTDTPKCPKGGEGFSEPGVCPVDGHCLLQSYSEFHWAFYDLVPDQLDDFHVNGEVPLLRSTDDTVQVNMISLGLAMGQGEQQKISRYTGKPWDAILAVAVKADGNLLEIAYDPFDESTRVGFLHGGIKTAAEAVAMWTDKCKSSMEASGNGQDYSQILRRLQSLVDNYDYYAYTGMSPSRMFVAGPRNFFWKGSPGKRAFDLCMWGVEKPWPKLYMNGNMIPLRDEFFFNGNGADDVDHRMLVEANKLYSPLPGYPDWEYRKVTKTYYFRYKPNFNLDRSPNRQKSKLMLAVEFVPPEGRSSGKPPGQSGCGFFQGIDLVLHPTLLPPEESLPDGTMCGYGLKDVKNRPTAISAMEDRLFSAGTYEKICASFDHPELPCPPPATTLPATTPPPTTTTTTEIPVKAVCAEYGTSFEAAQEKCRELEGMEKHHVCIRNYCIDGNPDEEVPSTTTTSTVPGTTTTPTTTSLPITTPIASVQNCICTDPPALSLRTPRSSNLGGLGPDTGVPEGIVYPDAGVVNGQVVNVHVEATSTYAGKGSVNGIKGELGRLNLNTGSSLSFTIAVVDQATGQPVNVGPLPITWLDLDEGRGGKGRATVKICGATRSVAGDSELTLSEIDGCLAASSSTRGTAKDNPSSVQGALVDPVAKKRVVSYVMQANAEGKYPVSIEVAKGFKQRNILWSLNTGMACVEENLPAECRQALDEEDSRQPRVR